MLQGSFFFVIIIIVYISLIKKYTQPSLSKQ